ncbi:hypothetical protein QAD02_013557 [Eretmocerus hayati]|uniref:Uncharacterized protein n=1 Tax=Eretmocerus hayati TaxID=131215 RepID=A0ACC2P2G9_9HYME|nr:hypothetical protein QAD02_013557 [Eretmocerus hayati]
MSRGRPRKVQIEEVVEALKKYPIFNETGDLRLKSDTVWLEVLQSLETEITLSHLYLIVSQDRNDVLKKLLIHNNLKVPLKPKRAKKKRPKIAYDREWDEEEYCDELDSDSQDEDSNALNFMLDVKNGHKFQNLIHRISVMPFIITYWHPDQVTLWNKFSQTESVLSLIVLNDVVPKMAGLDKSKNITLFALTAKIETSTISFTQMISDSSDPMDLEFFLTSWLQNGAPPPAQITIGYAYNLLDATSLAFNFCSFDEYNLRCYKYLSSTNRELPSTRLQLDIMTVIKTISQWPSFKEMSKSVQDFYACSIMYLSTVRYISVFEEIAITVLTLCQSPYMSEDAEKKKEILWIHIQSDKIKDMLKEYDNYTTRPRSTKCFSYYDPICNQIILRPDHELHDYIDNLKNEAFNLCDFGYETDRPVNDFYCPIILESLMQLLAGFPCWTQIIPKKVECTSLVSSNVMSHSVMFPSWRTFKTLEEYLGFHIEKVTAMNQVQLKVMTQDEKYESFSQKNIVASGEIALKAGVSDTTPTTVAESEKQCTMVEAEPSSDLDLESLKITVMATTHLMSDFDSYLNMFLALSTTGQETKICQTLLECCKSMKRYKTNFGILVEKLCYGSSPVAEAFGAMFEDIYKSLENFEENQLKNIAKLYAYLLSSDSISWEIFSAVKVNEEALTDVEEKFLKRFLLNLSELMDDRKMKEKFLNVFSSCEGLFPSTNERDSLYARNFYKSIGLVKLAYLCRHVEKQEKYTSISEKTLLPMKRKKCESVKKQVRNDTRPASNTSCVSMVESEL